MWPSSDARKRITKIKNKIFAIPAAAMAIPANPKIAAMSATIKNPSDHLNVSSPLVIWIYFAQIADSAFFAGLGFMSRHEKGNRRAVRERNLYLVAIQQDVS